MHLQFQNLAQRQEYIPLVIRWWHSVWSERMGSDFRSLEIHLHRLLKRKDFPVHMLALQDEQPVAIAVMKLHELEKLFPKRRYWLGSVFVEPSCRGRKLGSSITQYRVELAQSRGLPHLHLQTQNLSGGLYTSLGWKPLERLTVYGEETLLMVKQLG